MNRLGNVGDVLRLRVIPAVLIALGVAIVTFGLVSLPDATAGPAPSASSRPIAASPSSAPSSGATIAPSASAGASGSAPPSLDPAATRVATRVAVPALEIDLPVILQPPGPDAYPLCNVAMYLQPLGQPGQGRATYLYAHAREGMFLPLLAQSEIDDGAGMLGLVVQVWTSDEQLFLYEISEVRRHATDLDDALAAQDEQVWLQTSEGPRGTVPKLQVVARFLSSGAAANPADAHPEPRPVECD